MSTIELSAYFINLYWEQSKIKSGVFPKFSGKFAHKKNVARQRLSTRLRFPAGGKDADIAIMSVPVR